jgi:hypothetical protein
VAAACYRRGMGNATGEDPELPADRGRLTERLRLEGGIVSRGLVEGRDGEHDDAPFALYAIGRPEG